MGASLQHTSGNATRPTLMTSAPPRTPSWSAATIASRPRYLEGPSPEKIRSNGVHGLEYFVAGSPEALKATSPQEQDAYFAKALGWLKARHAAENVLSAVIHRDETTLHDLDDHPPRRTEQAERPRPRRQPGTALGHADRLRGPGGTAHGLECGLQGSPAHHERVQRA